MHNQYGVDVVKVLALIIVIGVITVVGWAMFNLNQQKPLQSFANYDQCAAGGGRLLNGDIAACLAGSDQLFLQYSAQNLPRMLERKKAATENNVENIAEQSADLIDFLKQDQTGCEVGYYKILKEVPGRFALMNYGCDNYDEQAKASAFIVGMKLADGWVLLSPTNHMNKNGMPSCLLADMFTISKELNDQCFENTGYNNGSLRAVTYP